MNSLPTDIINLILNCIPNIMIMRVNKRFNSLVCAHEEYSFWLSFDSNKVYKYGKVKMFSIDTIKLDLNKLHIACEYGNLEVVKYLVSANADVHANHNYALIYATKNECIDVIEYLKSL